MKTSLLTRRGRGRRRLLLGATTLAVGLVVSTQSSQVAALGGTADPDGPVGTADTASGLLSGLLGRGLTDGIVTRKSSITAKDGKSYWVNNHLDTSALPGGVLDDLGLPLDSGLFGSDSGGKVDDDGVRREYLVVWAGDNNVLDKSGAELTTLPKTVGTDLIGQKDLVGPDFFAVVDATKGSPSYGKVVNTATVGPLVENEPHHMQYIWHKGDNIFAGGLFTDVTYVLDTSAAARS